MIGITPRDLPATTADALAKLQADLDSIPAYSDRVGEAKMRWARKPAHIFNPIRLELSAMCAGSRRCMYCEDSCADEVEHIYPKDYYPDKVFVWENYLYACGQCNGGKNNAFAIFDATGAKVNLTRKRNDPVTPPPAGDSVFLNPRADDPLRFLALDLRDTFAFIPMPGLMQIERTRAEYTITTLKLNREVLVNARREAFESYRARLREYITQRDPPAMQTELDTLIVSLQRMQHPTVWREMQRQAARHPELKALFDRAPEALTW